MNEGLQAYPSATAFLRSRQEQNKHNSKPDSQQLSRGRGRTDAKPTRLHASEDIDTLRLSPTRPSVEGERKVALGVALLERKFTDLDACPPSLQRFEQVCECKG